MRLHRLFRRPSCWTVALVVVLSACATATTTPPISRDLGSGQPTPRPTTTTVAPAPTTTLEDSGPISTLPSSAGALITPSGVVVAVLEHSSGGYLVRTPCGDESFLASGSPISNVDVVVDPGHGGEVDPGAPGRNGLTEAEINLDVAIEVAALLEQRGIVALLTRTGDYSSPLGVRAALADNVAAELMVSIHHNAPTANLGSEPGTEVFVQHDSPQSRRLGGLLYEKITGALQGFDIVWSIAPDAGVLEVLNTRGDDAYGMLRNPETVTALAELGYISNPAEAELFTRPDYVDAAATAVADAIDAYLHTDEPGSGFTAEPRVFNPQRGISGGVCEDPSLD